MRTRWQRRRIERRLAAARGAGEDLQGFERLGLGGWWVLSDVALYVLGRRGEPRRLPLSDIRSVRVTPGPVTAQVTVISGAGDAVVGDLKPDSALVARLRALPSSGGASP